MDITALNAQIFNASNSPYVPFSAAGALQPGATDDFAELLRRMQNSDSNEGGRETPISASSRKTPIDKSDKLYEQCLELETFLIKNLIKSMRSTIQKSNLIDQGFAGEMYEDMLYDEYAKQFTRNANLGLAELAYRDLAGLR